MVLGDGAAAGGLGVSVAGGHGAGLPAACLHELGQRSSVGGEVLGHADAGAVAGDAGLQAGGLGRGLDAAVDLGSGDAEDRVAGARGGGADGLQVL